MPNRYKGRPKHAQTNRIARQLRREWRRNHPVPELVPNPTILHIDRARVALPAELEAGSLAYRAATLYLDTRLTMTDERIKDLGAGSAASATDMLVFNTLVPDKDTAPIKEILDVSRGVSVAKIALKHTMLYE